MQDSTLAAVNGNRSIDERHFLALASPPRDYRLASTAMNPSTSMESPVRSPSPRQLRPTSPSPPISSQLLSSSSSSRLLTDVAELTDKVKLPNYAKYIVPPVHLPHNYSGTIASHTKSPSQRGRPESPERLSARAAAQDRIASFEAQLRSRAVTAPGTVVHLSETNPTSNNVFVSPARFTGSIAASAPIGYGATTGSISNGITVLPNSPIHRHVPAAHFLEASRSRRPPGAGATPIGVGESGGIYGLDENGPASRALLALRAAAARENAKFQVKRQHMKQLRQEAQKHAQHEAEEKKLHEKEEATRRRARRLERRRAREAARADRRRLRLQAKRRLLGLSDSEQVTITSSEEEDSTESSDTASEDETTSRVGLTSSFGYAHFSSRTPRSAKSLPMGNIPMPEKRRGHKLPRHVEEPIVEALRAKERRDHAAALAEATRHSSAIVSSAQLSKAGEERLSDKPSIARHSTYPLEARNDDARSSLQQVSSPESIHDVHQALPADKVVCDAEKETADPERREVEKLRSTRMSGLSPSGTWVSPFTTSLTLPYPTKRNQPPSSTPQPQIRVYLNAISNPERDCTGQNKEPGSPRKQGVRDTTNHTRAEISKDLGSVVPQSFKQATLSSGALGGTATLLRAGIPATSAASSTSMIGVYDDASPTAQEIRSLSDPESPTLPLGVDDPSQYAVLTSGFGTRVTTAEAVLALTEPVIARPLSLAKSIAAAASVALSEGKANEAQETTVLSRLPVSRAPKGDINKLLATSYAKVLGIVHPRTKMPAAPSAVAAAMVASSASSGTLVPNVPSASVVAASRNLQIASAEAAQSAAALTAVNPSSNTLEVLSEQLAQPLTAATSAAGVGIASGGKAFSFARAGATPIEGLSSEVLTARAGPRDLNSSAQASSTGRVAVSKSEMERASRLGITTRELHPLISASGYELPHHEPRETNIGPILRTRTASGLTHSNAPLVGPGKYLAETTSFGSKTLGGHGPKFATQPRFPPIPTTAQTSARQLFTTTEPSSMSALAASFTGASPVEARLLARASQHRLLEREALSNVRKLARETLRRELEKRKLESERLKVRQSVGLEGDEPEDRKESMDGDLHDTPDLEDNATEGIEKGDESSDSKPDPQPRRSSTNRFGLTQDEVELLESINFDVHEEYEKELVRLSGGVGSQTSHDRIRAFIARAQDGNRTFLQNQKLEREQRSERALVTRMYLDAYRTRRIERLAVSPAFVNVGAPPLPPPPPELRSTLQLSGHLPGAVRGGDANAEDTDATDHTTSSTDPESNETSVKDSARSRKTPMRTPTLSTLTPKSGKALQPVTRHLTLEQLRARTLQGAWIQIMTALRLGRTMSIAAIQLKQEITLSTAAAKLQRATRLIVAFRRWREYTATRKRGLAVVVRVLRRKLARMRRNRARVATDVILTLLKAQSYKQHILHSIRSYVGHIVRIQRWWRKCKGKLPLRTSVTAAEIQWIAEERALASAYRQAEQKRMAEQAKRKSRSGLRGIGAVSLSAALGETPSNAYSVMSTASQSQASSVTVATPPSNDGDPSDPFTGPGALKCVPDSLRQLLLERFITARHALWTKRMQEYYEAIAEHKKHTKLVSAMWQAYNVEISSRYASEQRASRSDSPTPSTPNSTPSEKRLFTRRRPPSLSLNFTAGDDPRPSPRLADIALAALQRSSVSINKKAGAAGHSADSVDAEVAPTAQSISTPLKDKLASLDRTLRAKAVSGDAIDREAIETVRVLDHQVPQRPHLRHLLTLPELFDLMLEAYSKMGPKLGMTPQVIQRIAALMRTRLEQWRSALVATTVNASTGGSPAVLPVKMPNSSLYDEVSTMTPVPTTLSSAAQSRTVSKKRH